MLTKQVALSCLVGTIIGMFGTIIVHRSVSDNHRQSFDKLIRTVKNLVGTRMNSAVKTPIFSTKDKSETPAVLVEQRNEISKILNQKLETLAQMECDTGKATSTGGAYCAKGMGAHATDKSLIQYLKTFFAGKRIGSFGEGLGYYKKALTPYCKVYDGYDGAPFTRSRTNGSVNFLDLSVPQYGLPTYDIIISMEVAEHIPKQFEQIYLDNVVRYASSGIILSWAKLGQGGYAHVNNQPIEYVIEQTKKRGFERSEKISKELRDNSTLSWLVNNLNYYQRVKW